MQSTGKNKGRIAAVGMFDGVHRGHAHLLQRLVAEARARSLRPLVLTFSSHPLSVLRPQSAPKLISGTDMRRELLMEIPGIEDVEILDFDEASFKATAADFLAGLKDKYGVEALVMGFNNHIGSDRRSGEELVAEGYDVIVADEYPGGATSSSRLRQSIVEGDFEEARNLAGHPFAVRGKVVEGRHLGRTIGFPTANIAPLEPHQLLPREGVYAVDVRLPDGTIHRGMANIGSNPTVGGTHDTLEVNIFDFSGDLYGATLDIIFLRRIRSERRFPTLAALAAQLASDRQECEK